MNSFSYEIQSPDYSCEDPKPAQTKAAFIKFISDYDWETNFENYLRLGNDGGACCPPNIILNLDNGKRQAVLSIAKMREESDGFSTSSSLTPEGGIDHELGITAGSSGTVVIGEWFAQNLAEAIKLVDLFFDMKFSIMASYDNEPDPERVTWCRKRPFPCPKYHSFVKKFGYEGEREPDRKKTYYYAEPNFYILREQIEALPIEPNYEIKQLHSIDWGEWQAAYEHYRDQWDEVSNKFAITFPVGIGSEGLTIPEKDTIEDIVEQKMREGASIAYNKPADDIRPWDKPDWDNIQREFVDVYPFHPHVLIIHKNVLYYNLQSNWYEPKEELNENILGPAITICKPAFGIGAGQINDMIFENYKDKFVVDVVIEDLTNDRELNISEESTQTFYNLTEGEVIELWKAFYRLDWDFIIKYNERSDKRLLNLLWNEESDEDIFDLSKP